MSQPPASLNRVDSGTELFIDALRGIAAIMVFATHAFDLAISKIHGWSFGENPPLWRVLRAVLGTGEYWVWCFFVISGFCIHLSIRRGLHEGSFQLWSYALARVTRIYPLYLAGFVLAILTYNLVHNIGGLDAQSVTRQLWSTLFSLQIFTNSFPSYEASWSLSCEMIFYAAWPALLLMTGLRVRTAFNIGMVGCLLVLAGILVLWSHYHKLEDRAFVGGIWTLCALFPLWLCGARLASDWDTLSKQVTRRLWLSGMISFMAAMAFLFTLRYLQYPAWSVHMASWLSLPGIFLMIAGARYFRMDALSEKGKAACRWLGQLSYPCYLLHVQLLHLTDQFIDPYLPEAWTRHPLSLVVMYFIVILPVLALTGPPLERAIMAWRSRLLSSTRRPAVAVSA